jgi:hypothetical protein
VTDIGPGDMVECIEPGSGFARGVPYRVRDVGPEGRCSCMRWIRPWAFAHVGLRFSNAADPPDGTAWCVYSFRPISRKSAFDAFLAAVSAPSREPLPAREGAPKVGA